MSIDIFTADTITYNSLLKSLVPPFHPLAVRFGRIPKREKQRLLDEMQSYMNSLNESASMDIDSATPTSTEAPPSPRESQSEEGMGTYRHIFVNREEKPVKMSENSNTINNNNNNNNIGSPSSFPNNSSQDSGYVPPHSHTPQTYPAHSTTTTTYDTQARCPVAHHDNNPTAQVLDNNRYSYPKASNQSQGGPHSQGYPANNNSYLGTDIKGQTSCPWRLAPGTKVLVRVSSYFASKEINFLLF